MISIIPPKLGVEFMIPTNNLIVALEEEYKSLHADEYCNNLPTKQYTRSLFADAETRKYRVFHSRTDNVGKKKPTIVCQKQTSQGLFGDNIRKN
jgi:hypothetical protein